tara:strand:- start:2123 stop:3751 length:1629 start_codon:yes stop_codon:yes gene_type:complete
MADTTKNIVYNITINDKGKVKIDNLTKSFVNADNAVNKLTADLKKQQATMTETTSKGLNPMIDKTGLAGATIVELGRTISDSNYGIRGMANNLSQLSTLMITLIMTTGSFRNGMLALKNAFMGPLGLIVLFQIAIAALERFSMEQEKAKEKTEDLTKSIDDQIKSYNLLNKAVGNYNLGGEALRDTVKLLSSEFKEFDKAFQDLADNEFKLTIFETDVFGESIKKVFEGEEAIAKLTETFTSLMQNERQEIILNQQLEDATGKKKIKLEGELRELLRERIGLRKILDDLKRVEGAKDIADLEEKIDLTYDLQEAELELENSRVADFDAEALRDAFVSQFKQQNIFERIDAEEKAALGQLKEYEKDILNFEVYQQRKADIQRFFAEERAKYMQDELDIIANATAGMAHLFGEQSDLGKAFAIITATIDTYAAANKALNDPTIPSTLLRTVAAAGIIATGLGNVRKILEVDTTGRGKLRGGGGTGGGVGVEAPDFNVVGASPQSQLAQSIRGQQEKPLRAFVVNKDIRDAEELDRTIDFNRSLG